MTSISPWYYAASQVATARNLMDRAASTVAQSDPRPGTMPLDPSLPGPDNPCFPFRPEHPAVEPNRPSTPPVEVEAPEAIGTPYTRAKTLAAQGMDAIRGALSVRDTLAPEVVVALENATAQATNGVGLLDSVTTGIAEPGAISARFQSSSLWLGLAGSLLQLNHGTSWPIDLPLLPAGPSHLPDELQLAPAH